MFRWYFPPQNQSANPGLWFLVSGVRIEVASARCRKLVSPCKGCWQRSHRTSAQAEKAPSLKREGGRHHRPAKFYDHKPRPLHIFEADTAVQDHKFGHEKAREQLSPHATSPPVLYNMTPKKKDHTGSQTAALTGGQLTHLEAMEHLLAKYREMRPLSFCFARPMKLEWKIRPYFGVLPLVFNALRCHRRPFNNLPFPYKTEQSIFRKLEEEARLWSCALGNRPVTDLLQ